MHIHVDLLPRSAYRDVVVVIDVLRTCTVAPVLFDRGLTDLKLTPSLKAARRAAGGSVLLIGERQGLPPEGFNYGNSPAELGNIDFGGRAAVLVSENAPSTLPRVADARHVLLGSLYNANAVASVARELATDRIDIVCCGFGGEEDLDDTLAAGLIAADLATQVPDAVLTGASRFAMTLLRAFPEPLEALWESVAGRYLRGLDLEQDIGMAARLSHSNTVPVLAERIAAEDGELFSFTARHAG